MIHTVSYTEDPAQGVYILKQYMAVLSRYSRHGSCVEKHVKRTLRVLSGTAPIKS